MWVELGDEDTKSFHAAATERYKINAITSIQTEDDTTVSEHNEKVTVLCNVYRNIMGVVGDTSIAFCLQELVSIREDLRLLIRAFL